MPRYVVLLKGINVGGRHSVPMVALRELVGGLGYDDVTTYIQSGNVIVSATRRPDIDALEAAFAEAYGFAVPTVVRSAEEIATVADHNPFADRDLKRVYVGFCRQTPSPESIASCDPGPFAPDEFAFIGPDLYLFLPNGGGTTKLPGHIERRVKVPITIRNWNTVGALRGLTGG